MKTDDAESKLQADMDEGVTPYVIRKKTGQRLPTFFEVLSKLNIENHSELDDDDMMTVVAAGLGYMMAETVDAIVQARNKPTVH